MIIHEYMLMTFGVFLVCKLTGNISWGWWRVLLPVLIDVFTVPFRHRSVSVELHEVNTKGGKNEDDDFEDRED